MNLLIRIYLIDSHPAKGSERTGSSALTVNQRGEPWALLAENLKLSRDELDSMNRGGNPNLTCNAQGLRAEQNGAKWNGQSPAIKNTAESSVGKVRPEGLSKVSHKGGVVCQ
jgi:hypothetical protein